MFFSPRSFLMFSCTSLSVSPFSKLTNAVLVRGPDSLASDDPIVPISPGCVLIRYVLLPLGQTTQPSYHISPLGSRTLVVFSNERHLVLLLLSVFRIVSTRDRGEEGGMKIQRTSG
uniref:Putative secreted peptide n=1 Tax=Anopheles braziliensis TaxID=58242 RepID=A0A2M3ZMK3_9DIPT